MKRDEKLLIHVMKPHEIGYSRGYYVDETSDGDEVLINLCRGDHVLAFIEDIARFVDFPSKDAVENERAHKTLET